MKPRIVTCLIIIFCLIWIDSSAKIASQPENLNRCEACASLYNINVPSQAICIAGASIVIDANPTTGFGKEIIVEIFRDSDPTPIATERVTSGTSFNFLVDRMGSYTVVVKCFQRLWIPIRFPIPFMLPGNRVPIGRCVYEANITEILENTIQPKFIISDYNNTDLYLSALSYGEIVGAEWTYGKWLFHPLCNNPHIAHRFLIDWLREDGTIQSTLEASEWIKGCPKESIGYEFSYQAFNGLPQNEIFQLRMELDLLGCINSESLLFRYLGRDGDNSLKLQMVRLATSLKGDEYDNTTLPGNNPIKRKERYVFQDCNDGVLPFVGINFQAISHPNFHYFKEEVYDNPETGPEIHRIIDAAKYNFSKVDIKVTQTYTGGTVFDLSLDMIVRGKRYIFYENDLSRLRTESPLSVPSEGKTYAG